MIERFEENSKIWMDFVLGVNSQWQTSNNKVLNTNLSYWILVVIQSSKITKPCYLCGSIIKYFKVFQVRTICGSVCY